MRGAISVAAVAALCLVPARTDACIHPGGGGGGGTTAISQKGQHAIAFFDGETEHLVVKIEYEADQPLESLGLVMPVPAVPKDYGTVRPGLFQALHDWVGLAHRRPALRSRGAGGGGGSSATPLRMLPSAEAGPYRIQPLQASGAAGVTALRTWMQDNDFAPIPAEALGYFAERNWTFLAVRVDPAEGAASLEASGALPPFRVTFESERIVYPLKLEAQGTFPVRLYVVTEEPLPLEAFRGATARGFEVAGNSRRRAGLISEVDEFHVDESPESLRWLMQELGAPFSDGRHHLSVLHARSFGSGEADPRTWDEELAIPPPPEGERLQGVVATDQAEPTPAVEEKPPEAEQPAPARATDEPDGCDGCSAAGGSPATVLPLLVALALVLRPRRRQ